MSNARRPLMSVVRLSSRQLMQFGRVSGAPPRSRIQVSYLGRLYQHRPRPINRAPRGIRESLKGMPLMLTIGVDSRMTNDPPDVRRSSHSSSRFDANSRETPGAPNVFLS